MSDIDLRCGDWRDVLADVGEVDALIFDAPYGDRTHRGFDNAASNKNTIKTALCYASMTPEQVAEFVAAWSLRCTGWIAAMSCSDLASVWRREMAAAGRYAFAPVACVNKTPAPRMTGDGPTSALIYLNVARPRTPQAAKCGSLPGSYPFKRDPRGHIGGKPVALMEAIIRDYTKPGDLVCDPFSGGGTTAIACESLGRRFVGSEIDPETHAKAIERIRRGVQLDLLGGAA